MTPDLPRRLLEQLTDRVVDQFDFQDLLNKHHPRWNVKSWAAMRRIITAELEAAYLAGLTEARTQQEDFREAALSAPQDPTAEEPRAASAQHKTSLEALAYCKQSGRHKGLQRVFRLECSACRARLLIAQVAFGLGLECLRKDWNFAVDDAIASLKRAEQAEAQVRARSPNSSRSTDRTSRGVPQRPASR